MGLLKHRHRFEHAASAWYHREGAPGIGGIAARAYLCRGCGAIERYEMTPNGHQQVGWGASPEEIYAALDREVVARLMEKARDGR